MEICGIMPFANMKYRERAKAVTRVGEGSGREQILRLIHQPKLAVGEVIVITDFLF